MFGFITWSYLFFMLLVLPFINTAIFWGLSIMRREKHFAVFLILTYIKSGSSQQVPTAGDFQGIMAVVWFSWSTALLLMTVERTQVLNSCAVSVLPLQSWRVHYDVLIFLNP